MADEQGNILRFVSGDLSPAEFRDNLYTNDGFEQYLGDDPELPANNYVHRAGGLYVFLLAQDWDDPGGVLDAQVALCEFLDRKSIPYARTNRYGEFYDLVLQAAPEWLSPDHRYVVEHIMPNSGGREGADLRNWLANQLLERFRYADQPPEWIQSPCWPIRANVPLVFLGQIEIEHTSMIPRPPMSSMIRQTAPVKPSFK